MGEERETLTGKSKPQTRSAKRQTHFGLNFHRCEITLSKRLWVEWNFAGPVRSATPRSSPL